jgi:prepilin-type N-terminal cleavage/methylation domain-containing protein/prepilin-type processing-associated H-X9-DG protein
MMRRDRGFTLIELLVVIAIIGILAAMLFPVFARARESARKIQCLSNVKNVAIAFQMYLTDYDRFPPSEHDAAVISYFSATGPRAAEFDPCPRPFTANPYLRTPVILDEYIKNRDVWRCPSTTTSGQWINGCVPDWFAWTMNATSDLTDHLSDFVCNPIFPSGWGGAVTDSFLQGTYGSTDQGGFDWAIGTNEDFRDKATSAVNDPAKYVVCGDAAKGEVQARASWMAYPEICCLDCSNSCWGYTKWEECSWTRDCRAGPEDGADPQSRKKFTRHMGGSNLGFADGHAKWMNAEAILFGGDQGSRCGGQPNPSPILEGLGVCGLPLCSCSPPVWKQ